MLTSAIPILVLPLLVPTSEHLSARPAVEPDRIIDPVDWSLTSGSRLRPDHARSAGGGVAVPTWPLMASGGGAASPGEAAEQARRQTGGRVLSVVRAGGGYQVKVLTPRGEVRLVFIPARG
jgi:hypothetical protein